MSTQTSPAPVLPRGADQGAEHARMPPPASLCRPIILVVVVAIIRGPKVTRLRPCLGPVPNDLAGCSWPPAASRNAGPPLETVPFSRGASVGTVLVGRLVGWI